MFIWLGIISSVHMVVDIPSAGMKFDIDWLILSTHAHFKSFRPGRFIWEIFIPLTAVAGQLDSHEHNEILIEK